MALVDTVGEILAREGEGADAPPTALDVGAGIEIEQRIRRCGSLGVVGGIAVVLPQIAETPRFGRKGNGITW